MRAQRRIRAALAELAQGAAELLAEITADMPDLGHDLDFMTRYQRMTAACAELSSACADVIVYIRVRRLAKSSEPS